MKHLVTNEDQQAYKTSEEGKHLESQKDHKLLIGRFGSLTVCYQLGEDSDGEIVIEGYRDDEETKP